MSIKSLIMVLIKVVRQKSWFFFNLFYGVFRDTSDVRLSLSPNYTPRNEVTPGISLMTVYWIHPVRPSGCPSVCLSVRPSVRPWVGVRMITLILFSGFINFFYIYHLGQDLAWDWISASYLIKYAHTGRSCDLLIFGIPEVNFLVRAFQFGMKGVLSRIYDMSPGFCCIPIFVFFLNFLRVS